MLKNGWILISFLISHFAFSQAEASVVTRYSEMDGIHYASIQDMTEDNDNFLWFMGNDDDKLELNNDAKSLVIQRLSHNSIHSIPLPDIGETCTIYKRADGKFLLTIKSDQQGLLFLFDPISCVLSPPIYPDNIKDPVLMSPIVPFQDQLLMLIQSKTEITLYSIDNDLEFSPLFTFVGGDEIYSVANNTVIHPWKDYCLISNRNMPLFIFDWGGNQIKSFEKKDFVYPVESSKGKHPWIDEYFIQNGVFYFFLSTNPQLFELDKTDLIIKPVEGAYLETNNFEIIQDQTGNAMIVSNDNGVLNFNQFNGDNLISVCNPLPHKEGKLLSAYSSSLKNGVWISFSNSTLQYISFPKTKIKTYLPNTSIRSILPEKDGNHLVVTDNKGWYNLDLSTDSLTPYSFHADGMNIDLRWSSNVIPIGDTLWANVNGALKWINLLDKTVHKASRYFPALCLAKKNDSTIIYGTSNYQLVSYSTKEDTHTELLKTDTLEIIDIEIDGEVLVAGSNKGLLTYNWETGQHQLFQESPTLPDQFIISITKHAIYKYLLGTKNGYLISFDPQTKIFQTIYKDERDAAIATVLTDDQDNLWINTFNGIVKFNPQTKDSQRFSTADGLSHNEANRFSALKTAHGMFVGTVNGLNYFNPNELILKEDSSELILLTITKYNTEEKAYEQTFDRRKFDLNVPIELEAEHRALSIDFGLKNGITETDYRYEYQLNGQPWVNLKREQSIHFPNLEPGKYQLEIRALNFANEQQGKSLLLFITANNFFYKTSWFYLLISLTIILILLGFIWQQLKRRKTQQQFSHDLIQTQETERIRIAKELHDSIGQQLSLIKRKSQNDNQTEISELAGSTLEEVRSISRNLYPALLKEIGLTESIRTLVNQYDEETPIFFTIDLINIDPFFDQDQALNIYRFTQEALNNSIKYAQSRAITVQITQNQNSAIELSIEDNGIGFDMEQKRNENTLGLKTLKERVSILKGTFEIKSTLGKGTFISALIPTK